MSRPAKNPLPFMALLYAAAFGAGFLNPPAGFWQASALYLFALVLPTFFVIIFILRQNPAQYLQLDEFILRHVLRGAVFSGFMALAFVLVRVQSLFLPKHLPPGLLVGSALAGVFEELAFRGLYLPELSKRLGDVWGNAAQAALFALLHLRAPNTENALRVVYLFAFGFWMGYFKQRSKSLYPPAIIHAAYNVLTVIFA
jgi:membrane protease YdiL (CAAX protease family)